MTPDYQPPRDTSWQVRLIQIFVVAMVVILGFVALTSIARNLASGISNESTATVPLEAGLEVEVSIAAGSTANSIAASLAGAGVISDAEDFESAIESRGVADQLKAGKYLLITGTDTADLIDILVEGAAPSDVYRVTVIEGLTIDETLVSLAEQTPFTVPQFERPLTDGTADSPYLPDEAPEGYDDLVRWEGLLAPDTYEFDLESTPADIVEEMADTLSVRLSSMDWSGLEDLGYRPYDGLVIASLVEKEAKLSEERPTIASVIFNRLEADLALQIDATIIYALGENKGEVTLEDLEVDSPYNTYQHTGLPPTPIGGVRVASLEAASDPDDTDYYYYVLIDTDGTHGFSETLEEHNEKKEAAKEAGVLTP